jgi:hypothetical protein
MSLDDPIESFREKDKHILRHRFEKHEDRVSTTHIVHADIHSPSSPVNDERDDQDFRTVNNKARDDYRNTTNFEWLKGTYDGNNGPSTDELESMLLQASSSESLPNSENIEMKTFKTQTLERLENTIKSFEEDTDLNYSEKIKVLRTEHRRRNTIRNRLGNTTKRLERILGFQPHIRPRNEQAGKDIIDAIKKSRTEFKEWKRNRLMFPNVPHDSPSFLPATRHLFLRIRHSTAMFFVNIKEQVRKLKNFIGPHTSRYAKPLSEGRTKLGEGELDFEEFAEASINLLYKDKLLNVQGHGNLKWEDLNDDIQDIIRKEYDKSMKEQEIEFEIKKSNKNFLKKKYELLKVFMNQNRFNKVGVQMLAIEAGVSIATIILPYIVDAIKGETPKYHIEPLRTIKYEEILETTGSRGDGSMEGVEVGGKVPLFYQY